MNLRQKRKHYKYSYRFFVAWFSVHDESFSIPCPKQYKKTLKQKLKIKKTYYYDGSISEVVNKALEKLVNEHTDNEIYKYYLQKVRDGREVTD